MRLIDWAEQLEFQEIVTYQCQRRLWYALYLLCQSCLCQFFDERPVEVSSATMSAGDAQQYVCLVLAVGAKTIDDHRRGLQLQGAMMMVALAIAAF